MATWKGTIMAVAGSLTYDTKIDKNGFEKGLSSIENSTKSGATKIKNIIAALGITKLISTAFNIINNNIDGAISRLDTLNNFPKVMSNLGIKTDESSKAINRLSEGLKGLPTTLDAGALAVQRFTSKNGDVNKSVDLFLAVNNAILAGGASAEIQSTALEQLSQAYAKGKPDMMEWRSIQTAMPAQLKQIAKAMLGNEDSLKSYLKVAKQVAKENPLNSTAKELVEQLEEIQKGSGDMTTALGTALRSGIISMDDFMDTIVELNQKGTGEFLSFEEQAKNSTGGIQTSITNAKTAIVRGVANIIDAIDSVLKKTKAQGLGNLISQVGKVAENALKRVADTIKKVDWNKVIAETINIFKKLLPIIISVTSAYVAYKATLIAITAINFVKGIVGTVSAFLSLIPAIKSAKDAMLLLNMTMNANPVGIVVAGITALTAAIALSVIAINKEKNSLGGLKEEVESQRNSWDKLKSAREESLSNSMAEIATTQKLADELRQMTDENGKVKDGYENRAKYILGELNKALGTEYELNGNIISQYSELRDNIDALIQSKRAEATLDAYKEEYQTAIKNQQEATKTLTELRQRYNEELAKSTKNNFEAFEKEKNLKLISKQIREQTSLIGEYGYTIRNYEELTSASVSGNAEEISNAIDKMGTSYDDLKNKTNTSLNEQISSQANYVALLEQSWLDAVNKNDTYQQQILQNQLDTQRQELNNLAKSLAEQTSTVEDLTEEQKTAWSDLASRSIDAYNEGLSSAGPIAKEKIEQATGITVQETEFPNGMKGLAYRAVEGFELSFNPDGTVSSKLKDTSNTLRTDNSVSNAATILASSADSGFNNNVDGNTWGNDLASNISSGMKSNRSRNIVSDAASTVAGWISSFLHFSVPDVGPLSDFDKSMPDMIDLMAYGINSNKSKLTEATRELSKDIESSFNLSKLNDSIISEMNKAVAMETGSINASASVKANNSMLNIIQARFDIDGSVNIEGQKAGRIITPYITKTIKAGGLT